MFGYLFNDNNTPEEQGQWGEMIVNSVFQLPEFRNQECYLYKDVYIKSNGWIYQIDHIFICYTGIFVIETKMVTGRVFGDESTFKWTSIIGKRHTYFSNPINQNKSHIKALGDVIGAEFEYDSIIVFPNKNKPSGCPSNVLNIDEIKDYILSHKKCLTHEDMIELKAALDNIVKNKRELRLAHINQIKN